MHSLIQVRVQVANRLLRTLLGRGYVYCSSQMNPGGLVLSCSCDCLPQELNKIKRERYEDQSFRLKFKGPEECLNGLFGDL